MVNGYPYNSEAFEPAGEVPLVRIRDVLANEFETFIAKQDADAGVYVEAGDVVIGMDGDFNSRLWNRPRAALNQRVCALRDAPTRSDARFVAYALPRELSRINELTYSTTVKHLSSGQVKAIRLAMPNVDGQRAIADYLDRETARIDELIVEQEALLNALLERRRAAVAEGVAPAGRPSGMRLKHVLRTVRQGWSPQCEAVRATGDEWGVLKTGCVNNGSFRPEENKKLPEGVPPRRDTVVRRGEVVVCRASTRDLVGSAAVITDDWPRLMLSDKLYALTVDTTIAEPGYVALRLGTRAMRDLIEIEASGASHSMQNISQADILNLPMELPALDEQRRVLSLLKATTRRIDDLMAECRALITLLKERRAALITAAVTGQIDARASSRLT